MDTNELANIQDRPFLDYYKKLDIVPVRQEISDLGRHFRRRSALLQQLGLVPDWLEGKSIIEFGPGSGDNAVHLSSLEPATYVFVDGNPSSIAMVRDKIRDGRISAPNVELLENDILSFSDTRRFDLVLCEGVIPGQANPDIFAAHVAGFAKIGGAVIFSTLTRTSLFPEVCRRVVKPIFAQQTPNFKTLSTRLTTFFRPDLESLVGMSRKHEDWVLDWILQPHNTSCSKTFFSIPEAIKALSDRFDFHGSCPRIYTDWRWYKRLDGEDFGFNERAQEQYWLKSAALLDYRLDPETVASCDGVALEVLCDQAYELHTGLWQNDTLEGLQEFLDAVAAVANFVGPVMPSTARSLSHFIRGMKALAQGNEGADFGEFRSLFGRGQQYVSFLRRR